MRCARALAAVSLVAAAVPLVTVTTAGTASAATCTAYHSGETSWATVAGWYSDAGLTNALGYAPGSSGHTSDVACWSGANDPTVVGGTSFTVAGVQGSALTLTGQLFLTGASTLSGALDINANGSLGGGGAIALTGDLDLNGTGASLSDPVTQTGTGTVTWSGDSDLATTVTSQGAVTLTSSGTNATLCAGNGAITTTSPSGVTVTDGTIVRSACNNATITTPTISVTTGALATNLAPVHLVLTGANTSTISGSTLDLDTLSMPAGSGFTIGTGAVLSLAGPGSSLDGDIAGPGALTGYLDGTLGPDGVLSPGVVTMTGGSLTTDPKAAMQPEVLNVEGGFLTDGGNLIVTNPTDISAGQLKVTGTASLGDLSVTGTGGLTGSGTVTVDGSITLDGHNAGIFGGVTVHQHGAENISGTNGAEVGPATITSEGNASFSTGSGTDTICFGGGSLQVAGSVTFDAGSSDRSGCTSIALTADTVVVSGTGTASYGLVNLTLGGPDASTVASGQTLTLNNLTVAGGTLTDTGTVALLSGSALAVTQGPAGGKLTGTGTVNAGIDNAGTVSPGDGTNVGTLTAKTFTQEVNGTLTTGVTDGSHYGALALTGTTKPTLGGKVAVTDAAGFTPDDTTKLAVLTCASCTAAASTANLTVQDNVSGGRHYQASATATEVDLALGASTTTKPDAPSSVVGTAVSGTAIDVAVGTANPGSSPVTGYVVTLTNLGNVADTQTVDLAAPGTAHFTGLTGEEYSPAAYATSAGGNGPTTTGAAVTVLAPPYGPSSVVGTASGSDGIDVHLGAAPASNTPVTGYVVTITHGSEVHTQTLDPATLTAHFSGLPIATYYTPAAYATSAGGDSVTTTGAPVSTYTPPPAAPTAVVSTPEAGGADITCQPSQGVPVPNSYTFTLTGPTTVSMNVPTCGADFFGLVPGLAYAVSVVANDAGGSSAVVTGPSVIPFAAPLAPVIDKVVSKNGALQVFFHPNPLGTAMTASSPTLSYQAECGLKIAVGATSPLTVTGLKDFTKYDCVVTETDAAGTSPAGSGKTAWTGPLPKLTVKYSGHLTVAATLTDGTKKLTHTKVSLLFRTGTKGAFRKLGTATTNSKGVATFLVHVTKTGYYEVTSSPSGYAVTTSAHKVKAV